MKICFISFEYPPFCIGGAGVYAGIITDEISKIGHELCIVTPQIEEKRKNLNKDITVVEIPIKNRAVLRSITFQLSLRKFLYKYVVPKKFDIIHINALSGALIPKCPVPKVVTCHHVIKDIQQRISLKSRIKDFTSEGNPLLLFFEAKQLKSANKIIAVSHGTKNSLVRHYGIPEKNIYVVHNGIYPQNFKFSSEEIEEIRYRFGADASTKLIFCPAARINDPRKGVKYLLQALPKVLLRVNAKCIISGAGKVEPFQKFLRKLPKNSVKFVGFLEEKIKRKMLCACDVFVLPSLLEGCPLSVLEAMAAGAPIVSTKVGGIPELVRHGRNGILVKPAEPMKLAEAILSLIDEETSIEIRKNNLSDARELFSWEKTAKKTVEVYEHALQE